MRIIAGKFRSYPIIVPKTDLRPTSSMIRESFFNSLQDQIEGKTFLDLFAGSGAMGLEALSRGASFVTFVDNDRKAKESIAKNLQALEMDRFAEIVKADVKKAISYLGKIKREYFFIFIDPPYKLAADPKWVEDLFLSIMQNNLLHKEGSLFLEKAADKKPPLSDCKNLFLQKERKYGSSYLLTYGWKKEE